MAGSSHTTFAAPSLQYLIFAPHEVDVKLTPHVNRTSTMTLAFTILIASLLKWLAVNWAHRARVWQ